MAVIQFGNSWWGKQWLDSLTLIDYDNRLSRGKTYARNGSVLDFQINQGLITSKVQGSQRYPYKQEIALQEFDASTKQHILEIIQENPYYLSKLKLRQLPPELHQELNNHQIFLFPTNWKDLDGNCSCPDWALPCKHLAAVIYLIANEIDQNPFLIFKLRGLDLLQALGLSDTQEEKLDIPRLEDLIQKPLTAKPQQTLTPEKAKANLQQIYFSDLPDLQNQLLSLVSDNPVFYPQGNFKNNWAKVFNPNLQKKSFHKVTGYEPDQSDNQFELLSNACLFCNSELEPQHFSLDKGSANVKIPLNSNLAGLLTEINSWQPQDLAAADETVWFVYTIYNFAVELYRKSAALPQIWQDSTNSYQILWTGAFLNQAVQAKWEEITLNQTDKKLVQIDSNKDSAVCDENQALILLQLFLSHLIWQSYQPKTLASAKDEIEEFFFLREKLPTSRLNTIRSIYFWLKKLHPKTHSSQLFLEVREAKEDSFKVNLAFIEDKSQAAKPVPFQNLFTTPKFKNLQESVMETVGLIVDNFPELSRVLASKGKEDLTYSTEDFLPILQNTIPILKLLGMGVQLPKSLHKILKPRLTVKAKSSLQANKESRLSLDQLLDFDWQIVLGGQELSKSEFLKLVKQQRGLVKFQNQYLLLEDKEIQRIEKQLAKNEVGLNGLEKLQAALGGFFEGEPIIFDSSAKELLEEVKKMPQATIPASLQANLRKYQEEGFCWLYKNYQLGFGSLIADDMGLGKTLQVITLLLKLKEESKQDQKQANLVIVPTSLLTNWKNELAKFAPSLKVGVFHGQQRKLETRDVDVLLTTYGIVRSETTTLKKQTWQSVVIDEAQNMKNLATTQTKAVKSLSAPIRIAMTGTPVENSLSEFYSIFDYLNKGYLGSQTSFKNRFLTPIEKERNAETAKQFKNATAPFVLRRVKSDKSIIQDLPDKISMDEWCTLTKEQTVLYESVLKENLKSLEQAEGISRKGLVLKLLTELKQICNHPAHFRKKARARPEDSGKLGVLINLVETILKNNEKVLIFTQFTEMGHLLSSALQDKFGILPEFLHGGVSRANRDQMVKKFQEEITSKIFILTLKAGGTGLNLVEANNVIHYDLWWNPAVENQATDRAYRIGQNKKVMVHRLITKNSFEEKINQMIQDKRSLADMTVATGEKWLGDLSSGELKELFKLEKTKA